MARTRAPSAPMDSYPPLLGLSLAPRETSAAPEEEQQGSETQDLQKHRVGDYRERLEEWKSKTTLKERWYQHMKNGGPRAYFEDDPRFYKDWIPVAEQESYFYERRDFEGNLTGVMHPANMILRVAADSMGIPIAELAELRTWIVDGSNLVDANQSRIKIQDKIKKWKVRLGDGKYPGDCAIIVCKAEGLSDFKNTQPIKDEKGKELKDEKGDPVWFEKDYNGFGRLWDWMQYLAPPDKIFLVVVEDWIDHVKFDAKYKGTKYVFDEKKQRNVPKKDQVRKDTLCGQDLTEGKLPSNLQKVMNKEEFDELEYKHYKCEYDDTMCITLRQLLAFHRAAAAADAAAAAAASDSAEGWEKATKKTKKPQPLGHKTFGEWGPDEHTGDPTLRDYDTWGGKEGEGANWRLSPDVGVVTDDKHMWENLYPEAIARSYAQLLKFSDVFRIRIFMPLGREGLPPTPPTPTYPKPPPVAAAIKNIYAALTERYKHPEDYMFSDDQRVFFEKVLLQPALKGALLGPTGSGRLVRVPPSPANWAFTNLSVRATPPGWGEARTSVAISTIAARRHAVVQRVLGAELSAELETWYQKWKTAPAPIPEPLDIVAFLKSLEEKAAAAGPSSEP